MGKQLFIVIGVDSFTFDVCLKFFIRKGPVIWECAGKLFHQKLARLRTEYLETLEAEGGRSQSL